MTSTPWAGIATLDLSRGRSRAFVSFVISLQLLLPAPLISQTRGDGAEAWGPPMTTADSGLVFPGKLTNDAKEFWFFKKVTPGQEDFRIFRAERVGDGWSVPVQVTFGGEFSDLYPAPSPDGRRLVFSSYRPVPGDTSTTRNAHLWFVRRTALGWSAPEFIALSALGHYHSGVRHEDDSTLRYVETLPDWSTQREMRMTWNGNTYAHRTAVPEHPAVSHFRALGGDTMRVVRELVAPDGLVLIQVQPIDTSGRRQPARYFFTSRVGEHWAPLRAAGAGLGNPHATINFFSADGRWVHYTERYARFLRAPLSRVR